MNFLNRLRYGSVAQNQDEAETLEYKELMKTDFSREHEDHDYGKSAMPDKYNLSLLEKGKGRYWTTKQYVKDKFGSGDDVFAVAEDTEIDGQVHRARHLQKQMVKLSMALLKYQKVVQSLTGKETSLGLLLAAYGESEAAAGIPGSNSVLALGLEEAVQPVRDLMCKLGGAIQSDALMLAELDAPIAKLFQEVETFRCKALSDCLRAISELNSKKLRFHGALLWMTDAANSLSDPDAKKELENFREAQFTVKKCKAEFEEACIIVASKTELLLSSLHNLFAVHFPCYVSALANQLQASDVAYGDIHRWTRESMIHQYKRAVDINRERVVSHGSREDDSGFETVNTSDEVRYENWSNEDSLLQQPPAVEQVANISRNLDWLLEDNVKDSTAKTCEDIQDLLIELSQEAAGAPSAGQRSADAKPSSEELDKALDCNMASHADMFCDGEIKQITNDEASLEDVIPMDRALWQRQQDDIAREQQISNDLDALLAGLNFDIVLEPVQPEPLIPAAEQSPSPIADVNQSNKAMGSVADIWQSIENNFTPVSIGDEVAPEPADAASANKGNASSMMPEGAAAGGQRDTGLRRWFSRATPSSTSDATKEPDDGAAALKFSSILDKLAPDADERALDDLLQLGDDFKSDFGEALM